LANQTRCVFEDEGLIAKQAVKNDSKVNHVQSLHRAHYF